MTNKSLPTLDSRLSLAASFVRADSVVADIGTDHAYLPIYLVLTDRSKAAIAADINEGPLERAKINCEKYGVSDRITLCLADGLSGLPLEKEGVTDIVICGMGGELIASIIDASEYTKKQGVRLILQPMSQHARLRTYLCENGYRTIGGTMARAQDRLYQCIVCEYDGQKRSLSPAGLLLGEENINAAPTPVFIDEVKKLISKTKKAIQGRTLGGLDNSELSLLLSELEAIYSNISTNS